MMATAFRKLSLPILLVLSAGSIVFASVAGSVSLGPSEWWAALLHPDTPNGELLWRLRLPRAFAAWAVGAMLTVSGCLMQVLLRNPLADPYILGISGGASVGVVIAVALGLGGTVAGLSTLPAAARSMAWISTCTPCAPRSSSRSAAKASPERAVRWR